MSAAAAGVAVAPGKLTRLMKDCGSATGQFGPEAPEQRRWLVKHGEGKERLLALIKMTSVDRGSPFCVGADGRPMRIENLAAELGLAVQTARNYCTALVSEGRIRTRKAQVWYRADVPEESVVSDDGESEKTEDDFSFVQRNYPAYVVEFYKHQSARKQAVLAAQMRRLVAWRMQVMKEGVAALRSEIARVEVNTFSGWGAPKIVLPKKDREEPQVARVELLSEPSFVQGTPETATDPVYKAPSKVARRSVQNGPSLLGSEVDTDPMESVGRSVVEEDRPADPNVKGLLLKEWGALFPGEAPTARLCGQIASALQGAPLALLGERMRQRRAAAVGMGFALALALDVGKRYVEGAADRNFAAGESTAKAAAEQDRNRRFYRSVLADPHASADEKKMAAEFLEMNPAQSAAVTRREAERILADPNSYADDKAWAREVLKTERAKAQGG